MRSLASAILAASVVVVTCGGTARAQGDRDDHWRGDRDIHHFAERDVERWRGGHWFHGPHGGRGGWWWVIGDQWYNYPAPVYPYPDPYLPPTVALAPAPAPNPSWYYCANPPGYYPYVAQCAAPWQPVAPQ